MHSSIGGFIREYVRKKLLPRTLFPLQTKVGIASMGKS